MGKILVIAEKPSVGRDIANVLGAKSKGDNCLVGDKYIVSWAIGHLVTLAEPEEYDAIYKKWDIKTLPIIPDEMKLKAVKKTISQLKVLKSLMNDKDTDSIIVATDSGREGELIFRYIYSIVKCKKPFKRLWISSMTDIAIKEGFSKLKDGAEYDHLYLSAKCRSKADWLVGMNATRAYTIKYNTLLSIGRVQTPTLGIIVKRQQEIDAFDAKEYFEVKNEYGIFTGTWIDKASNSTKIDEKEKADKIAKSVKNKDGFVENVDEEEKSQPAPLLYDLTELQRDCNKKFGFSAQKTLTIAQDLYEKRKMITYPRTDSRYLSDDMKEKVKNTLLKLSQVSEYETFAKIVLEKEKIPFSKRIIDNAKVSDHHAIIPTDGNIRVNSLTPDEKRVYHIVVLRFLCVFYPNYVYSMTKIYTNVDGEIFISKGTTVLKEGWNAIYNKLEHNEEKKKQKNEDQMLPTLNEGDVVHVEDSIVLKKKTNPPLNYTESSLLSAMENAGRFVEDETLKEQLKDGGLGTPATRASIIERLIAVGYITRKGKSLIPTEKGMKLIEIVPEELKSPQTTGKWEKGLSSIAKGKMAEEKFMQSIQRYVHFLIEASKNANKDVVFPVEERFGKSKSTLPSFGKCPSCNSGSVLENSKSFYCSNWKSGCKFSLWKNSVEAYGIKIDSHIVSRLLSERSINDISLFLPQTGEKKIGKLVLAPDNSGKVNLEELRAVEEE